jgi:ABC-type Fe3+ transport system permease subunit
VHCIKAGACPILASMRTISASMRTISASMRTISAELRPISSALWRTLAATRLISAGRYRTCWTATLPSTRPVFFSATMCRKWARERRN